MSGIVYIPQQPRNTFKVYCAVCSKRFTVQLAFSRVEPVACPGCGATQDARYDLSPAKKFGSLHVILGRGQIGATDIHAPWHIDPADAVMRARARLADYDASKDYILALGDPVAIAIVVAEAARASKGRCVILKWDRQVFEYYPVGICLGG